MRLELTEKLFDAKIATQYTGRLTIREGTGSVTVRSPVPAVMEGRGLLAGLKQMSDRLRPLTHKNLLRQDRKSVV